MGKENLMAKMMAPGVMKQIKAMKEHNEQMIDNQNEQIRGLVSLWKGMQAIQENIKLIAKKIGVEEDLADIPPPEVDMSCE